MSVRIRGSVITPSEQLSGATIVVGDHGKIEEINEHYSGSVDHDADGCLIVPGFVDVHVHGGGGADFMDGAEEAARTAARTHARFGTTTMLATTLTATRKHISRCIGAVNKVIESPADDEARIAGIHLEGPYICAAKRGAQPLAPIRPPDWAEMERWMEESRGAVKLITMAPEIDGALDFIRRADSTGIRVSIGHTNATYDQTKAALDAGASHATHLFNAMPPLHHREPGVIGAVLESGKAFVEVISDGVHLHPAIIHLAVSAAGSDRVILITDAISGAAMPDGMYELGGTPVIVRVGTAKFDDGTLAGSVLTMNRAFANVQKFAAIPTYLAARMASANAARHFGLADDIGSLEIGKRADLALIRPDTGDVEATMREGKWIWKR